MRRPVSTRWAAAVLVVALHVPLVAGLLYVNLAGGALRRATDAQPPTALLQLLPPPPPQRVTAPAKGPPQNGSGAFVSPDTVSPLFSPPAAAPALGLALFGCAPENLKNLTRAQQEKCLKLAGERYVALKDGFAPSIKLPGPEWEGLRNSDLRARERNTADPCQAAKATGTECIHEVIYGKGLW